ncbi:hypothetical protein LX36DRAFT_557580, partial [Colletotrichum falcatum]
QIRLFVLQPGDPESEVQGDFAVVDIGDETNYNCVVSYDWGDPLDTTDTVVGGERFVVTTSLFLALRRIRSPQEPVALWADALCVDQQDNEERRLQVNMVFTIYRDCSGSFIWLREI